MADGKEETNRQIPQPISRHISPAEALLTLPEQLFWSAGPCYTRRKYFYLISQHFLKQRTNGAKFICERALRTFESIMKDSEFYDMIERLYEWNWIYSCFTTVESFDILTYMDDYRDIVTTNPNILPSNSRYKEFLYRQFTFDDYFACTNLIRLRNHLNK